MKLRVIPLYGHGWFRSDMSILDVPEEFDLIAVETRGSFPFEIVVGKVEGNGHLLSGRWLLLSRRTSGEYPTYNLSAFADWPEGQKADEVPLNKPVMTGFCSVGA